MSPNPLHRSPLTLIALAAAGLIALLAAPFAPCAPCAAETIPGVNAPYRDEAELVRFMKSAYGLEHNPCGVHLLTGDNIGLTEIHLDWSRELIGEGGVAKNLFMNITARTKGPTAGWIHFVTACYERQLVPFVRLAGIHDATRSYWLKPEADAPGDYTSMAEAVKRVVAGLPRMDGVPLYIEIWNEPGLTVEWSGEPDIEEYGHFLVDVAAAIRSIGDDRIVILNAGLIEFEDMFDAVPESVWAFDVLSSHPYPFNRPPESNNQDGTAGPKPTYFAIDGYVTETEILARYGRPNIPVILTETGHDLGNQIITDPPYPIIDEDNRADYIMRAFRDYWPYWPEVIAVLPFEFASGGGWTRFDWAKPDSETDANNWPVDRYKQFDYVAWLAKPNDPTGAINGKILQSRLDVPVEGVTVTLQPGGQSTTTGPHGNYFFPKLDPGVYHLTFNRPGFTSADERNISVRRGRNSIIYKEIAAIGYGTVEGRVVDGSTGAAVPGASISLKPGGQRTQAGADGTFRFAQVIPSTYIVSASRPGTMMHRKRDIAVTRNETTSLEFRVARKTAPETTCLIKNVSFEDGDSEGVGIGWEIRPGLAPPARGIFTMDHRYARTGDTSQRLAANLGPYNLIEQYTHYSTMRAGREYVGQVWVKATGIRPGSGKGVWLEGMIIKNDMTVLETDTADLVLDANGDADWTLLEVRAVAPRGAGRLRLTFYADAEAGEVWIDDAFVGLAQPGAEDDADEDDNGDE